LGPRAHNMPSSYRPLETDDEELRRAVQHQKRSEWDAFAETIDQPTRDALEPHIRRSEAASVAALNYLEDHPLAETAHEAIHRAAFVRRGLFGCPVVLRDDGEFWSDCSINMSHLRAGMSAELVSEFECSVCGRLVEDCDHFPNGVYDKIAGKDAAENCTICQAIECEHELGKSYPVVARAMARSMAAEGMAMVPRPRYPQARMVEQSMDLGTDGEDEQLRQLSRQGHLHCDGCLGPCKGFNDMRTWEERRDFLNESDKDDVEIDPVRAH
ncbi:hypothetical protein, partial [Kitasatospora herbaricolor]|uniref:hypothetical protein n=1 Tax=Kitasatospora herbaricolor TaxID=68217 RepID=UPI0036DC6DFC